MRTRQNFFPARTSTRATGRHLQEYDLDKVVDSRARSSTSPPSPALSAAAARVVDGAVIETEAGERGEPSDREAADEADQLRVGEGAALGAHARAKQCRSAGIVEPFL